MAASRPDDRQDFAAVGGANLAKGQRADIAIATGRKGPEAAIDQRSLRRAVGRGLTWIMAGRLRRADRGRCQAGVKHRAAEDPRWTRKS